MVKKFSFVLVLLTALIIIGGNNQAEAREVYVGSYSDGTAVYLLTDSIRSNGRQGVQDYTCRVRAGRDYLFYHFYYGNDGWVYNNNEGYSGRVYDGSSPVAAAILNYIRK
ncbi:MAG: hypothetical protein IJ797_06095 [Selenomonadaceae bacterium]|nr:hypothetical protein [Selenomonadaceae bacterium]